MGKGRIGKLAICVLLVVSILALSVSIFADDPPVVTPYPDTDGSYSEMLTVVNDNTAALLIYTLLKSWGIKVEYGDVEGYSQYVGQTIRNWVFEYLDEQPSIESILAWYMDWKFATDFWGNLVVNQTLLDDVMAFGDWLVDKYGLTNNNTQHLNPIYAIDNLNLYDMNTYYPAVRAQDYQIGMYVKVSAAPIDPNINVDGVRYFVAMINQNYYFVFVSTRIVPSFNIHTWGMRSDGTEEYRGTSSLTFTINDLNVHAIYVNKEQKVVAPNGRSNEVNYRFIPADANIGVFADENELASFLAGSNIIIDSDGAIITSQIVLPQNDPNYTEGDSVIIVDGSPEYQVIEWPESVSVNNIPAVVSTTTIQDPDFEGVYGEVTPFIRTFSGGMDMMRSIIMQLPEESIACLFALMGAIIIFGFIKIMREH